MTKLFYSQSGRAIIVEDDATVGEFEGYGEDYVAPPVRPDSEMAADARELRDKILAETDKLVIADRNPSPEMLAYRQALRDLPDHPDFPRTARQIPARPEK
jgi:hypothetical protein